MTQRDASELANGDSALGQAFVTMTTSSELATASGYSFGWYSGSQQAAEVVR